MGDDSAMDKAKGKAKEMTGKVTGNDRMKAEGQTDQARGKAKEGVEGLRDKAEGVRDSLRRDDDQ
ncbi:CsbD family protein [Streptomyces sp. NBC_00006]|uniref:CsbD family protein n=1 Tax=unclassified Streptomyces TaxID=2593676 RepID=UPI00225C40D4|nr:MULTISPECIES: CsbD family protein [unclassified Streptomyces]MCX5536028.1 CsbD family protein [Streptomyces sp. NBC_00006]